MFTYLLTYFATTDQGHFLTTVIEAKDYSDIKLLVPAVLRVRLSARVNMPSN